MFLIHPRAPLPLRFSALLDRRNNKRNAPQVISGALHVSDHLSYLEVDYTKAYLQCVIGQQGGKDLFAAAATRVA